MDHQKKPLKSALKKTTAPSNVAGAARPDVNSSKRKLAPSVSASAEHKAGKANKRAKHTGDQSKGHGAKQRQNPKEQKKAHGSKSSSSRKSVTIKTSNVARAHGPNSTQKPKMKKVSKPKDIVVPEDATKEDFRIVAGTYENILYGVDAYWNEDMTLKISPIFIFSAHIGCIKATAIGGHYLASGSTDEKIQLYDLKRRKELGALLQHQGTITSLTFHDKTHMLSGSADGKICVWRTKDWECLKIMKGHQGPVNSIAIHPTGKLALSVASDRSVRVWDLLLGKQASMVRLQAEGLKVAWSPSGTGYSIMFDQEIGVYDMATAKCIRTIKPTKRTRMNTMIYYKDDYLVVGCEDKVVRVYNSTTGDLVRTLIGHSNRIKAIDIVTVPFTPNETSNKGLETRQVVDVLTSVSSDGVVLIWNMGSVIESGGDTDMKEHIGKFNMDMRVTCIAVQKGIWKNINAESTAVQDEDEMESDDDVEEPEQPESESEDEDEDE
ncbi:hypothetical protein BGW38_000012 [Lunasporangiospora selenospora]|uniref:WD40 repeat-like protein n=1 Tax=Lunasporangiospora selenospora TaxID=979761 RepID=A0A9P6G5P2_9FUNG|nr:hypothetical protein BGW38_000012 [Lunasporangiospora selenospora]